jgi:tRNA(Ile)-lysidine synthetase-like protein
VVLDLADKREGTRAVRLPGDVVAAVRYGEELVLYRVPRVSSVSGESAELRPGTFGYGGWDVDVREVPGLDPSDAARPEVAYLDAGKGPYGVRMAREGDEIRPLGLGGTKKVFRAMMDRKVPRDLRRRTPVVVDGWGKVVWVFGGELSEEFKVGEGTEKMLRVEVREDR